MSHDRRPRRVLGVLACVLILAAIPGCRRSPFHRLGNAPITPPERREGYQPPVSALDQAAVAPVRETTETSMAAAIPPDPADNDDENEITDESIALASDSTGESVPTAPAPTPMLDEALRRAEALERAQNEAMRQVKHLVAAPPEFVPEPEPDPVQLQAPPPGEAIILASAEVEVEAEPTPVSEPEPPAPLDPAAEWRDGVDRLKQLARESADRSDADDEAEERARLWAARAELIDCLPDDLSAAVGPAVLPKAVALLADAAVGPDADASTLSTEIETAVSTLEDRAPLGINALELCRRIDGFGSFETIDPQTLKAGRPVLVYCELVGLRYGQEGDEFVSRVVTRVELLRAEDGAKVWEIEGEAEDRSRRRRRDSYVSTLINLPETIEPGAYSLRLTQTDEAAGASASSELAVVIGP